ncbi:MAG: YceI family protein [Acidobacteriota bacterium]
MADATTQKYTIDKAHSEAVFQVRHLITKVRGRFTDFEGAFEYNDAAHELSSVTFSINAASIDTNAADRDAHLRSADFFDVEHHPRITFTSTSITGSGGRLQVTGPLTIRGVSKVVTLPVSYLGGAKDPWGNLKAGFETDITLNRKDFGLNWNAALEAGGFLVGDEVKVTISVQGTAA